MNNIDKGIFELHLGSGEYYLFDANEDIDLDAAPEEGKAGEVAEALDALQMLRRKPERWKKGY